MKAVRRRRISPALVVAGAALLIALGDTGWATVSQLVPRNSVGPAQLRNNAVTSAKIRNGQIRLADLHRTARRPGPRGLRGPAGAAGAPGVVTRLWAVMNGSGSISRGAGTTSAGRLGAGVYEVVFNQNVQNCVYVASVGDPAEATGTNGAATVARRAGNANAIRVETRNLGAGGLADRAFHVIVVC
jgi:hypothetical protein